MSFTVEYTTTSGTISAYCGTMSCSSTTGTTDYWWPPRTDKTHEKSLYMKNKRARKLNNEIHEMFRGLLT